MEPLVTAKPPAKRQARLSRLFSNRRCFASSQRPLEEARPHQIQWAIKLNKLLRVQPMPYEVNLNLPEILRTTLYLIDNTTYPGKDSKTVENLRRCLSGAIAELSVEKAKYEEKERER